MTVVLFIVILAVLVFVHELGHFLLAKASGIRVDEFAVGFPPRLFSKKIGETEYSVNLIPFGGYVKIYGEEVADVASDDSDRSRSLFSKNRVVQALVLCGGILANFVFAWMMLSLVFMIGAPVSSEQYVGTPLVNERLLVLEVVPLSPADQAGIHAGDIIVSLGDKTATVSHPTVALVQQFISAHEGREVNLSLARGAEPVSVSVIPERGVIGRTAGIGISMDLVGTLKLSLFPALVEGANRTVDLSIATAKAIGVFLYQAVAFHADLSQISGPVGIAALVGSASTLGWFYLLSITALISINLAIINLIPFPALDGGRLLFVLIESITRRTLPPRLTRNLNTIGFALLVLLLVLVTFHDIAKLV